MYSGPERPRVFLYLLLYLLFLGCFYGEPDTEIDHLLCPLGWGQLFRWRNLLALLKVDW
jgi:hypothetical protein